MAIASTGVNEPRIPHGTGLNLSQVIVHSQTILHISDNSHKLRFTQFVKTKIISNC